MFEVLVRPAETPDIRPGVPAKAKTQKPADGVVTWGKSGGNVFFLANTASGFTVKDDVEEVKRKYDKVRVKNPDDPDQHVDVEVLTEYQARNRINKSRYTLRFESPENTATTQVLSRGNTRNARGVS